MHIHGPGPREHAARIHAEREDHATEPEAVVRKPR